MNRQSFDRPHDAITTYIRDVFLAIAREGNAENLQTLQKRFMEIGLPKVVPGLIALLADADVGVRLHAATWVRMIRTNSPRHVRPDQDEVATQVLVAALRQDDLESRMFALIFLGLSGGNLLMLPAVPPEVVPLLRELLTDLDQRLRVGAAIALLQTNVDEWRVPAFAELQRALASNDPWLCTLAAGALGRHQIRTREAVDLLSAGLRTIEGDFRLPIVNALLVMGTAAGAAVPALLEVLGDEAASASLRCATARTLGTICGTSAGTESERQGKTRLMVRSALLLAVKSSDWRLVWGALDGLQASGGAPPEVLPMLVNLLDADDEDMRSMATLALGEIRPVMASAVDVLIERLEKESSATVLGAVVHALGSAGEAAIHPLVEVFRRQDTRTLLNAAEALIGIGKKAVPEVSRALLRDADEHVREFGVAMLIRFGRGAVPAIPAAIDLLEHFDPAARVHGAMVLGHVGVAASDAAVPALIRALADPVADVVFWAEKGLSMIGIAAVPHLREALQHVDAPTQKRVAGLLASYAGPAPGGFEWVGDDDKLLLFAWVGQKLLMGTASLRALALELRQDLESGRWRHPLPTVEGTLRGWLKSLQITLSRGMNADIKLICTEQTKTCGLTAEGKEILNRVMIYLNQKGIHLP